jgi:hypothetical protein
MGLLGEDGGKLLQQAVPELVVTVLMHKSRAEIVIKHATASAALSPEGSATDPCLQVVLQWVHS